jgi:hypothetical protein
MYYYNREFVKKAVKTGFKGPRVRGFEWGEKNTEFHYLNTLWAVGLDPAYFPFQI